MKFKKLRFSEKDKIEIEKFRKELENIVIDPGDMADIHASEGCGAACQITCSYHCEPTCGIGCDIVSCKKLCSEYALYQPDCPGCGYLQHYY